MGQKDTITKTYMRDNRVFADAFNFFLFSGKQVIDPAQLVEMDPAAIANPYGKNQKVRGVQKMRDVLKSVTVKRDERAVYWMLGIENQSEVHYAMPVRNLLYDVLNYAEQVERIAAENRREKNETGADSAEFLSGFHRGDRLLPVITLVVLFSPNPWDGPRTFREMVECDDPEVLPWVPDYKLALIEPAALSSGDMERFQTTLGPVLNFIKYSKDKKKLQEQMSADSRFLRLDRKAAQVIEACTNTSLRIKKGAKEVNMCQAIAEMIEDSRADGVLEGLQEGRLISLNAAMQSFHINMEQAMEALQFTEEERNYCLKTEMQPK